MVQEKKNRVSLRRKAEGRKQKIHSLYFLLLVTCSLLLQSCLKKRNDEMIETYQGPVMEVENVETLYSDSTVLRIRLKAPKQIELQNGDREFPNGVYVEFYDESGKMTSTLTANSATFYKEKNSYKVLGNVIIKNLEEQKTLKTEELNWFPDKQKVNTDKFIRIETPDQILTGEGLDAREDFSSYKIRKPKGVFTPEEESEDDDEEEQ